MYVAHDPTGPTTFAVDGMPLGKIQTGDADEEDELLEVVVVMLVPVEVLVVLGDNDAAEVVLSVLLELELTVIVDTELNKELVAVVEVGLTSLELMDDILLLEELAESDDDVVDVNKVVLVATKLVELVVEVVLIVVLEDVPETTNGLGVENEVDVVLERLTEDTVDVVVVEVVLRVVLEA